MGWELELRIERLFDSQQIKSIISHPEIYPYIIDDGSPSAEDYDPTPLFECCYFLGVFESEIIGCLFFHPENYITYQVHIAILPEYRKSSTSAMNKSFKWMFENTNCKKIIANVPITNQSAYALVKRAGMKNEGLNERSFMKNNIIYDQYILGITEEESCLG